MAPTAENIFLLQGSPLELRANQSFWLGDAATAWFIESGSLNIFSSPVHNHQPAGARVHLFELSAGRVLFDLGAKPVDSGLGFIAVGGLGTSLRKLPLSDLQSSNWAGDHPETFARWIEDWVVAWYHRLVFHWGPKDFTTLEPGQEMHWAGPANAKPLDRLVWVSSIRGTPLLCGQEEIPVSPGAPFLPLASDAWIQTTGETVLACRDTITLIRENQIWLALQQFGSTASRWLQRNLAHSQLDEGKRLLAKADSQSNTVARAISELASLLTTRAEERTLPLEGRDHLLAACRLVGQVLGVTFKGSPAFRAGEEIKDRLREIGNASRIRFRRVVLAGEWWKEDCGPLLGYLNETNRPVALLPASRGRYVIADPADQSRREVTTESARSLSPIAHTFYRPFPERVLTVWDLVKFGVYGLRSDLAMISALGAAGGALALLIPIGTGAIFDTIIPGAERVQLIELTLGLLVAACATVLFDISKNIALFRVETKGDASLQAAVWDRLLSLPVPFFKDFSTGDLAVRVGGIGAIRDILSGAVLTSILAGIFSVFNFGLLFYYSVPLAVLATGLVALSIAATVLTSVLNLQIQRSLCEVQGRISGLVLQLITGLSKLRVAGAERQAFAVWASGFSQQTKLEMRARHLGNGLDVFNATFPILTAMLLFAAVTFWIRDTISTGQFLAFNAAFGGFLGAMLGLSSALISLLAIVPIYERSKPILRTLPEVHAGRSHPGSLSGEIELTHVFFRYDREGPTILHDISFKVHSGEFIAIVGPSGSGKSTLLRLLFGFESPAAGAIYFDGHDLAGLDLHAVRRQFGAVLQNSKIMPGTILENIVGTSLLSLEEAWEAATKAGLAEDIQSMPMGMHTFLGEGASTLSGGQRQRLIIARAIASRPRILLFDEATSALDNRTQAIVSRSLDELEATRIVIAHRLSTIMHADRVLVLQAGRLVQSGEYHQLLQQPGPFAELAQRQIL